MTSKIFLIGFMGSGKTYWGKIWAEKCGLKFFDLDEQIEKITGEPISAIFEKKGEEYFREIERYVLRRFINKRNFMVACGGGTPCFFENLQWMNEHGVTIYLRATADEILERVMSETEKRPLLKKLNSSELLFFIQKKLSEREPFYQQAKHIAHTKTLDINFLTSVLQGVAQEKH